MKFDLHLHSSASDGDYTPTELVRRFKNKGYQAVALCDHDTLQGVPEFLRAGKKYNILTIPGVEMSSLHRGVGVHIIGLGINHRHRHLKKRCDRYHLARIERAQKIVAQLKKLGFDITYREVAGRARGVVNRPHIAKSLLAHPENISRLKKYVRRELTVSHIIQDLIEIGKPAYVSYRKMTTTADIRLIHRAGGLAILCHPWFFDEERPRINQSKFIASLKKAGLDGIEAYPYKKNFKITRRYSTLANKYKLLVSAGSDFHGPVHQQTVGSFSAPAHIWETIKTALSLP
jgi:3',5'-nucleoside bisphosphate phosphatase